MKTASIRSGSHCLLPFSPKDTNKRGTFNGDDIESSQWTIMEKVARTMVNKVNEKGTEAAAATFFPVWQ